MTDQPDGGPVYPVHGGHYPDDDPRNQILGGGMSLRDYFAGQALAGLASNCDSTGVSSWLAEPLAGFAYEIADAMLTERSKR